MTHPAINWPPPPVRWSLGADEVHVWAANLRATPDRILIFAKTLSADELARAEKFHFDRDRTRFIAGRGLLRAILGHYLNIDPARLKFGYSERGKPHLVEMEDEGTIHFNLAHTEDLALLAVTRDCNLGVDVERIRPLSDAEGIAGRFFSERESDGLKALPANQKPAAFFNLWTRKEAWLKATGDGIGDSLNQVEVTFLENEPARLISLFGDTQTVREWSLFAFTPAPEFIAALAVPAREVRVSCWHWTA